MHMSGTVAVMRGPNNKTGHGCLGIISSQHDEGVARADYRGASEQLFALDVGVLSFWRPRLFSAHPASFSSTARLVLTRC